MDVNWIAVIAAAVLHFVLGMIWYSPKVFGGTWIKLTGAKEEDMEGAGKAMVGAGVIALIIAFVMAKFVGWTGVSTFAGGACLGFWAWLGFIGAIQFSGVLWEKRPFQLYLINTSVALISLVLQGGILASWQ